MILGHRHEDRDAADDAGAGLVHGEGGHAEEDLLAGGDEGAHHQVDQLGGAGAQDDVIGAEALPLAEAAAELLAAAGVEVAAGGGVDDGPEHALARREGALVGHHPHDTLAAVSELEVVFPVGLGGADPARSEELHGLRVDGAGRGLVAEVIAEDPDHRLGPLEGLGGVDVDPAGVAHVAAEEVAPLRQGPDAIGEARVAGPLVDAIQLGDQLGADAEHARVDAVVVGDILADIDDPVPLEAHLGGVVEVEAALDVVVDPQGAGALRQIEGTEAAHHLRRVEVIRHRQEALLVDVLAGGQEGHAVLPVVGHVVDEVERQRQARLGPQRLLDRLAPVPDDDHGLPDALALERPEDPDQQRDARDDLQRLRVRLVGHQTGARTGRQNHCSLYLSICHRRLASRRAWACQALRGRAALVTRSSSLSQIVFQTFSVWPNSTVNLQKTL